MSFETKSTIDVFKNVYSPLADYLFKKLLAPPKKYTFNSVIKYYRCFIQTDTFHLTYTTEIYIEKTSWSINVRKASGMDEPSGHFQKDGSRVLSKPMNELFQKKKKLDRLMPHVFK